MKIISKFKDYYDGALSLGIDSNLIYMRKTELVSFDSLDGYDSFIRDKPDTFELQRINIDRENYYSEHHYINFKELVIGFCGKLYPAFEFETVIDKQQNNSSVFYKAEEIDLFFSELEAKHKNLFYAGEYNYRIKRPSIEELNVYLKSKVFDREYYNWFQKVNCPVFKFSSDPDQQTIHFVKIISYKKSKIFIQKNPNLRELEFYRIKDTYTVFQSIGQFLGGVLTNTEVSESTLNDKQKVHQHGFDEKYGFRKRPKKLK